MHAREEERPAGLGSDPRRPPLISTLLKQLARPVERGARFQREGVVAQGGMGTIHRARDLELNRLVALKELRALGADAHLAAARFCEEAQVTAQLDHPGIVPVHECGVDTEGRLYFAMKLVDGRDLREIFELVKEGREGWNPTRALGVLLKVCEAMAYAHSKGVLHRDLKPGNVMVGHFGEVYVMDWGLARVVGRADVHDIRLKLGELADSIRTERREEREETPDSPLVTMDGVVIGTPAYMAPEQARGEVQLVSPRSDVYSIGAMLYHLLTGQVPFVPPGAKLSRYTVLSRVIDGAPRPILEAAPDTPAELVAICEKAMAREPERRYPDTHELSEDLRAYLEGRVVRAHATGALVELQKWVRRNRALATASAAGVLALVGGLIASSIYRVEAMDQRNQADHQARAAEQRTAEVLRLSAFQRLAGLEAEADALWPVHPDLLPRYDDWMARAQVLVRELPEHERTLAGLRARARPVSPGSTPDDAGEHARARLEAAHGEVEYHERLLAAWKEGGVLGDPSAEELRVDPSRLPADPVALEALVRAFVGPERRQRCREAAGLFLARHAVARAGAAPPAVRSSLHLNLARALESNLRFEEALEQVQLALESCGDEDRAECEALVGELEESLALPRESIAATLESHLKVHRREIERCEQELAGLPSWTFDAPEDEWWSTQLGRLMSELEQFSSPEAGLCGPGVSPEHGWGMERRREEARLARERSLDSPEARAAWAEATAAIADRSVDPAYRGLLLEPLFGLLPIGVDPDSGLWEFAHLLSGAPPRRGADGRLVLTEEAGLVFVLIPGGGFWMGSQSTDPSGNNFDPEARADEQPMRPVSLAPFLASKYELTQGQWLRLTGSNPSEDNPGTYLACNRGGRGSGSLLHPVETVTCLELDRTLTRFGLDLPTEAQWEYLARAGSTTPWPSGPEAESVVGTANLYDPLAASVDRERSGRPADEWLDDGYISHAPVGTFAPNAYGLHDTLGNVHEWCGDWILSYKVTPRPGDGLREGQDPNAQRILRGGGHDSSTHGARVATRTGLLPHQKGYDAGARPVLNLPSPPLPR